MSARSRELRDLIRAEAILIRHSDSELEFDLVDTLESMRSR